MQFPLGEVADYAGRYAYADDHQVLAIGAAARHRGFFTREEFFIVCAWKTHRSKRLTEINCAEKVQAATRAGMARGRTGWQEINALRTLTGVDVRTASVFLHLTDIDRWPILDVRALHALGVPEPSSYGRRLWEAFVSTWRTLRDRPRSTVARSTGRRGSGPRSTRTPSVPRAAVYGCL